MTYSPDALRRWPDVEGPGLVAADAADRLILDESASARAGLAAGDLLVVDDAYGALTLGAAADGARGIRVYQDTVTSQRALAANAEHAGLTGTFEHAPLTVTRARVVLLRLPRSLQALREIGQILAAVSHPDVVVFAGGRVKHMTPAMNDVLRENFHTVDVTHARQKSRVLIARGPHDGDEDPEPQQQQHDELIICAYGGAFAGTSIDIGTRLLLDHLPPLSGWVIDFACGTGVIATTMALRNPELRVYASDQSGAAVSSAQATVHANDVGARVHVALDDLLSEVRDASTSFVALNPPFHSGAAVTEDLAPRFFAEAARVLKPGGELWAVWNSGLRYRPALERIVGPTRQIARNAKFTLTASTRR